MMHELSIALSIIDIATEECDRRDGAAVHAIHLKLGPLSGVSKDALVSAFSLARECSPFSDTKLVIDETQVFVHCDTCQTNQPIESIQLMCCSKCGTPTAEVVSGRELEITAMEIEELSWLDSQAAFKSQSAK